MKTKNLKKLGVNAYHCTMNPTSLKPIQIYGTDEYTSGFTVALYVEDGVITGVEVLDNGDEVAVLGTAATGEPADAYWYWTDSLYVDGDTLRERAFQTAGNNVPQEPQIKQEYPPSAEDFCTDTYGCLSCPDPDTCDNLRRAEVPKPGRFSCRAFPVGQ